MIPVCCRLSAAATQRARVVHLAAGVELTCGV